MSLKKTLIALGIAGTIGAAAMPAQADRIVRFGDENFSIQLRIDDDRFRYNDRYRDNRSYGDKYTRLSQRDVRRVLRSRGFERIRKIDYRSRREAYVAFAENRRGRDVRVVVDAFNGRVIDVDRVGKGRYRLSAKEVRRSLRDRGFRDIRGIDFRPKREVWVARAENRRGRDVRVVVDARNGRILDIDRLNRERARY